ncbi:MAG: tRNA pseudouridine(55) synthase TruB [Candidatus Eremiobacteraeota bacterium]|nr:tRNA pseudouridine(55) synthase TruB [Candidatus Eremiobacteraeota bacterium]
MALSAVLGFINVFKSAGPTSAQTVARVRRIYTVYHRDRSLAVGHLGTLDPQAAGVLPVALGKATRLIPLLTEHRKSYVCTLVLGRSTTTADATGKTLELHAVPQDWRSRLEEIIPCFVGRIEQLPPMFSAVHHNGKRLHQLAREGKTVERKKRRTTIYALTVLGVENDLARMRVTCSEGTYVRTLCEDLGAAMGVPAHMGALLREASGPFVLHGSMTLEQIAHDPHGALIAPENVIPFPTIILDLRRSADFRAGRMVPLPAGAPARHVFVRDMSCTLVGVGESMGTLLAPRKVFV